MADDQVVPHPAHFTIEILRSASARNDGQADQEANTRERASEQTPHLLGSYAPQVSNLPPNALLANVKSSRPDSFALASVGRGAIDAASDSDLVATREVLNREPTP